MRRFLTVTAALLLAVCGLAAPAGATPGGSADKAACALPGRTGWTDEGHDTDRRQFLRPMGSIRAVMVYVDFPDAPATEDVAGYRDQLAPGADWLAASSYGRADLRITSVPGWHRMPQAAATYGFDRGITFEEHELYVRQAVAAVDAEVDFSQYQIVYIVPTRAAAAISFSPTYLFDTTTAGVWADGGRVNWAVTFGQDLWHWGPKVLAHETGHIFGLPDLYSFTGETHQYVGGWDLMGYISGRGPDLLGWHKWKHGWVDDAQVACLPGPGTALVTLTALERPGGTKLAVVRTGETTAYVAESRRRTGADAGACGTGVLIYQVDSAAWTGAAPVRIRDARPDQVPAAGCQPLDDAPYGAGAIYTDPAAGVKIVVLRSDADADTVLLLRVPPTV